MSTIDLMRRTGELLGGEAGHDAIETGADRQQKIAVLHGEVRAAGSDPAGPADEQRMLVGDHIDRQPGGFDRNIQSLDQLQKLPLGPRQADAVARE